MIHSIAHPTDFSAEGQAAFEHALYLALTNRCRLDLLHVHDPHRKEEWDRFPHVRRVLQRWNLLPAGAKTADIAALTGVDVRKVEIRDHAPGDGLSHFINEHRPTLVVIASHGRSGINRWLHPSVSTAIAREQIVPTLVLGPLARPFVDSMTGDPHLRAVLVPVDHIPSPQPAVSQLRTLVESLEVGVDFVHVGPHAPRVLDHQGEPFAVRRIDGPVVEALIAHAQQADMVVMPMAQRRSLSDIVRGSTADRVIRGVSCPVLALPNAT